MATQTERLSRYLLIVLLVLAAVTLPGCEAIVGIFKAGVWTGVLGVFAVIALMVWGLTRLARR